MKIIVGLGNPGDKYAKIRHNLGFMVVDALARQLGVSSLWSLDKKFKSEIIKTNYQLPTTNYELILVKPQTFMNSSGAAVKALSTYYKLPPTDIIVIHDELDLPLGKIKVRIGGAAAGHHGVESIIDALNSDQFIRVRLGIGNLRTLSSERGGQNVGMEKFVLEPFMHGERAKVKHMVKQAIGAIETILEKGLVEAQNQHN